MNQAIQFPDRRHWDEERQAVCFPALVNGFQVQCAVTLRYLTVLKEGADPLTIFDDMRWDLEDLTEQRILAEDYDASGWIWLDVSAR
ncbi:DUF1488 domain-containing protein [Enterobacillus tribolii]|uniref:Uncharacterized protein DUF1488 n=1 Tax=Enterobacillus tribolii TaxID=1487935 RepID=A0A370Q5U1_9GAMM|nr:DUF1488 domain-containing protein [Enterobacillus tribolii]MBW7984988.1 DUF1488 domain-containing protein [Enterobacillus tribolii]RDK83731.1 uncharacterized protein DUF1488 [Enterobacillus tribolii]